MSVLQYVRRCVCVCVCVHVFACVCICMKHRVGDTVCWKMILVMQSEEEGRVRKPNCVGRGGLLKQEAAAILCNPLKALKTFLYLISLNAVKCTSNG